MVTLKNREYGRIWWADEIDGDNDNERVDDDNEDDYDDIMLMLSVARNKKRRYNSQERTKGGTFME